MARRARPVALAAAAAGAVFLFWLGFVWPPPSWWGTHWPAQTAFMAMRRRQQASAPPAPARRYVPVPPDAMSPWLPRAAIAGEDEAFYQHHGIDYHALREALGYRRARFSWGNAGDRDELWRALRHAWGQRQRLRGASTISQQLAKNLYLSPSRNPLRKLKEAVAAYRIEWALDKGRIMALYLNVAEFGPGVWGVEAASERYFGRSAARLSSDQAALLIATLPHPLTSNPSFRPGRTRGRQQLILLKLGGVPVVVPPEETEDTLPTLPPPPIDSAAPSIAPDTFPLDTIGLRHDSAAEPPSREGAAAKPPKRALPVR